MNQELLQRIATVFKDKFQQEPNCYFSPGRINIIGEHIDYNDGFVMPAAINKGVYYAIAPNGTDVMNFYSVDFDESLSLDLCDVKKMDNWKNYVLSVVNQFLVAEIGIAGFDCVFGGDIPRGSGMSSSAAVEGGIAFALNEMFNDNALSRKEIALLNQRAEHDYPNVKCGIMDQYANMNGKKDHVLMLDCRSVDHRYFPLNLDGNTLVLINTKVHHSLASSAYNERRKQCEKGLAIMAADSLIKSFRDVVSVAELEPYQERMGPEVYARCLFVVEETGRTRQAANLLQENDIAGLGKLMFETHEGLRKLYEVSCKELDFLVERARSFEGVVGSRLMGGGFGGCTINIVSNEVVDDFIEKMLVQYEAEFEIEAEAYRVQTDDGTRKL